MLILIPTVMSPLFVKLAIQKQAREQQAAQLAAARGEAPPPSSIRASDGDPPPAAEPVAPPPPKNPTNPPASTSERRSNAGRSGQAPRPANGRRGKRKVPEEKEPEPEHKESNLQDGAAERRIQGPRRGRNRGKDRRDAAEVGPQSVNSDGHRVEPMDAEKEDVKGGRNQQRRPAQVRRQRRPRYGDASQGGSSGHQTGSAAQSKPYPPASTPSQAAGELTSSSKASASQSTRTSPPSSSSPILSAPQQNSTSGKRNRPRGGLRGGQGASAS
ncbi:hypothetical protein HGRIS_010839 [Hohenbuehelia grisea]|uniref:Uncharacterized protein n=1 Tax=Hohenbuehelia grisea TaxID=104357 RepID=A0ABR3IY00_9AGAR